MKNWKKVIKEMNIKKCRDLRKRTPPEAPCIVANWAPSGRDGTTPAYAVDFLAILELAPEVYC